MADKRIKAVIQVMDNSWKCELTPDAFGDTIYCTIAEEIGIDNLLKLSRLVGGDSFYVPIESTLLRVFRNKKILEEYNGCNVKDLAKKYGITRRMVHYIVSQNPVNRTKRIQNMEDSEK